MIKTTTTKAVTETITTAAANASSSAYKATQVKHRRRPNNPFYNDDLFDGSVIDFSRSLSSSQHHPRIYPRIITIHEPSSRPPELSSSSSLPSPSNSSSSFSSSDRYDGPLFGLTSHPGFLYAPRALSERAILELAYESLSRYCERPHVTNRDGVVDNNDGGCQNSKRRTRRRKCDGEGNSNCINKKNDDDDDDDNDDDNEEEESLWDEWKRQHIYEKNNSHQRRRRHQKQQPSSSCRLKKISWSTMGYHYDWTNRSYHDDKQSIIPSELIRLAQYFARCCCDVKEEYHPQACIVNFYNTKSLMGGHRDDLELTFTKPVISLSMGRPAIFLLGGRTKDDTPVVPILIRPGDVMMLGGESRLCFHGMARVLPRGVAVPDEIETGGDEEEGWWRVKRFYEEEETVLCEEELRSVTTFLEEHRINVNVRQVLSDGVRTIREGIEIQQGMEDSGGV